MPRYRTQTGVVVDLSEEKAKLIRGLTPEEGEPPKKAAPRKSTRATKA